MQIQIPQKLKLFGMALLANLVPVATGIVQIILGNVVTGVGTIAGGIGAAAIQTFKADEEAQRTRSFVSLTWLFSRPYVSVVTICGVLVALILFLL